MDDFFERVREQAYKAKGEAAKIGKQVYNKTNNVISQTKLSFAINETESKITDCYTEIGKKLYEMYMVSGECIDEFSEKCRQIDALLKEEEALRERMSELKESVKCPSCGKYNKMDSAYCSKCGSKLEAEENAEARHEDDEVKEEIKESLRTAAKTAGEAVKDAAESAKDAFKDAGEEIRDAADYAKDEISDAAGEVKKTVKKVITIKAKKPSEE